MIPDRPRDALQRFIHWAVAGCLIGLAGMAFFIRAEYIRLDASVDLAQRSRETIDRVDTAGRMLADADAAVVDWLLTGEPATLATAVSGMAAAEGRLGAIGPGADAGQKRLIALGGQTLAELAQVIALPNAPRSTAAMERIHSPAARRRLGEIRAVAAATVAQEKQRIAERLASVRTHRGRVEALTWLTQLGMALVIAASAAFVRRELRARNAASDALRASQRELETSERRTRSIADALPALIGYIDRDEVYRFVNTRYTAFYELPVDAIVGKSVRDMLGAELHLKTRKRIEAALGGTPQTFERHYTRAGQEAHLLINFVPDRDADGEVIGFYVLGLDISDRKRAELAQQVNERRLRAINDHVPAIVAHLDRRHRYLHANEGFRRLWGVDPQSLIGTHLRDFRGEFVWAQMAEHLVGVLQGETRRFEIREAIDGIEHHFQHSFVPDLDAAGEVQGYYSVSFDITDLRRHEQLLVESSARHRSIVEEQSELVSLARPDGELIYVNPAYARHVDTSPEALVGANLLDFVDPSDREAVRKAIDRVLETGVMAASENRMLAADGSERWVAWTNTRQRDLNGVSTLRSVGRDVTEQRRIEQALRASEEFLHRTGRLAGVGGWQLDLETLQVLWSREVCRIHDVPEGHVPRLDEAVAFYAPEARQEIAEAVERAKATGQSWDLELPLVTATGRSVWVRSVGDAEYEQGRAVRLVGAFQDITARKLAEFAVQAKERLLRALTDRLPMLVMYLDPNETVRFVNETGARWLGIERDAAIDRSLSEVIVPRHYKNLGPELRRAFDGECIASEFESDRRGLRRHLQLALNPDRRADGSVAGVYATVTDITATRESERRLEVLARVDALTGLPNRRQFDEKLEAALLRSQRNGQGIALLFLDIDHFKSINDSLGHAGGDAVLKEFGARLKRTVRESDVVARLAGDEFVALLEGVACDDDASIVARKILEAMRADFEVDGAPLRVTTSLGVAVAGQSTKTSVAPTATELMLCADRALYEAKRKGRDGFRVSNFAEIALAA